MKVVFLSNYFTHHQKPFCDHMYKLTDHNFVFFSTTVMTAERKNLGWTIETPPYVRAYRDKDREDILDADLVLFGSAPLEIISERLKHNKIVFFCAERIYKSGYNYLRYPVRLIRFYQRYGRYKSMYLLCSSAYTSADYAKHFTFLKKSYKLGYFPMTKRYDINNLISSKSHTEILWAGRFLDWKHPETAVNIADRLRNDGYDFSMTIIGTGEMKADIRKKADELDLNSYITFTGAISPEAVRSHMESAGIFIFTSDFHEGWGAVLNEAMNSGCAVVASHAIGAVPYLIKHGENGLIYKNGDDNDLYENVKALLTDRSLQKTYGKRAVQTITDLWNAHTAAERMLKLYDEIKKHGECNLYSDGPCSRAVTLKNNWFNKRI